MSYTLSPPHRLYTADPEEMRRTINDLYEAVMELENHMCVRISEMEEKVYEVGNDVQYHRDIIEAVITHKSGPKGDRGVPGATGPQGPPGPKPTVDDIPQLAELIERIKDVEDRLDDVLESLDD